MTENNLSSVRHSLAHLLAAAVLEKYPEAKLAIGPVIESGFYYDIDFPKDAPLSAEDLAALENRMRELARGDLPFEHEKVTTEEARKRFADNPYKLELVDEITTRGEDITLYTVGGFTDLCRGGHVKTTEEIDPDAFLLTHIAGAYWRGDEKSAMLTRVYGLAFGSKEELKAHLAQLEEAKKRDHRKLGKELDLFTFSPLVGAGLPLWTPKGAALREQLDAFVWELRRARGYEKVEIPHITKKELYETSGHWSKFADELFKVTTREGKEYALKPMNCPHHTQIFDRKPHSYRDMPQRYANTTTVYRDEQSGELGGLTRVLSITQDDAHVFCRQGQLKEEFFAIWDIVDTFYGTFGFTFEKVRLSFHDPEHMEKYLGTEEIWKEAESALRDMAVARNVPFVEAPGEAALYGPKVDFIAKDSLGREHQVATIQIDMNLPERFDLTCVNEKGEKERIVMIHAAIMGSLERFLAVLIEHLAGNFPLWLSPVQVMVIPVGETQNDYARGIRDALVTAGIRARVDESNEGLGKKVRAAKVEKIPYFLVVGAKEMESNMVTVEHRDKGKIGEQSVNDFVALAKKEIAEKTL